MAFVEGVNVERIICVALSVALTASLMVHFKASHPPSAATTMIVSLGILKTPKELAVVMAAVLLLTSEAFMLNKFFRKDVVYPVWCTKNPKIQKTVEAPGTETGPEGQPIIVLENEMKHLTLDNFFNCFRLCEEISNDEMMVELLQFARQRKHMLSSMDDYDKMIPYATRVAIENDLI